MTLKKTTVLFYLLILISKVHAQKIEIGLGSSDTLSIQNPSRSFNDTSLIANAPYKKYPYWSLRRIAFYNLQATYENLPESPARKKLFKEFVERYELDTTYVTKRKIPENYIYLFNAIDSLGNRHVIVDANNNHDFKDDSDFKFSIKDNKPRVFNVAIKYYDGSIIREAVVPLRVDAFNNFSNNGSKIDDAKKLDIIVDMLLVNKTGTFTVNNKRFRVNVMDYDQLHPKSQYRINLLKLPFDVKNNNNYSYKSSDTLEIAGNKYTVKSLANNSLLLNYTGKTKNTYAETGTIAPDISSVDIQTSQPFSLSGQKGKYVLIDFWGSWCGPCIRLIPEVKSLYGKYKGQIQFVSIAYDKPDDLPKLQKLIKQNEMSWVQLTDNKNQKNGVIDQFKVNEFPTCLLIDKSGKVIYRGVADTGLKELIAYYENVTKTK